MTFDEFLDKNNLPHIGEIIVTPKGDKVEITRYVFNTYGDYVTVRLLTAFDTVVEWTLDQLKFCKREET